MQKEDAAACRDLGCWTGAKGIVRKRPPCSIGKAKAAPRDVQQLSYLSIAEEVRRLAGR